MEYMRSEGLREYKTKFLEAVYFLLACGMYYFHNEYLDLGIHFMYKFVLAMVIAGLSLLTFLVRTDLRRGGGLFRCLVLLALPSLTTILASVPLWVFQVQQLTQIRRGLFDQIYGLAILFAAAGLLYAFGRRGLWLNLAAMLGANAVTLVRVVRENGIGQYLEELRTLIVTFAGETGPVIQQMEIHELTFALGIYLVYYMLNWQECRRERAARVLLAPTLFCFLSGFKRIGVAAIAAALLVWLVMKLAVRRDRGRFFLMTVSFAAVGVCFLYIFLVKRGLFEFLALRFDLDTMGRRELSGFIDQYYWIGPNYFGNGAGFVSRLFSDLPEDWTIRALHNDILMLYIDIGFWGFWVWMLCYLPLRVWCVSKWRGLRYGVICLCLQAYVLSTAATDNTLYYVYVTGALAICLMSGGLEKPGEEDHAGAEPLLHRKNTPSKYAPKRLANAGVPR